MAELSLPVGFSLSSELESQYDAKNPVPNDRNDPPDLQQVYGRFTSAAGTQRTSLEVPSFCDCIAALVICPEHCKMALSYQLDGDLGWFPITPVKSSEAYSDSIKSLLESAFPSIEFKVPKVIQRKRFQVPGQYVNLMLYKAELIAKSNCVCLKESVQKSSISWESYEKIVQSTVDCLAGPEPLFIAKLLLENQQQLSSKDPLEEYTLKPISSWYCSPASEMVRKCAGLESTPVEDFLLLYGDFVKHCFPSQYMTLGKFESYVTNLPLYSKGSEKLIFKAFDVDKRKYLDFYQFAIGLALMDPMRKTTQEYNSLRVEYIYRFCNQLDTPDGITQEDFDRHLYWDLRKFHFEPNSVYKDPKFPVSCQDLVEFFMQNPIYNYVFQSAGRVTQMLLSSLVVKTKTNKVDGPFKLECDYLKIDSNGKWVEKDFIPYQIDGVSKNAQVSWKPQDNFELPPNGEFGSEHVNDFLLRLIRHFVHSPNESRLNEQAYRVSVLPYIIRLCEDVEKIFSSERRLLRISSPCYVFGDIHGSVQDIAHFDTIFWRMGPASLTDNYLILGDYVDRGAHSIECIIYLFVYKVLAPERFHLIRGNHEVEEVNAMFGFKQECLTKFREGGLAIWNAVNKAFNVMPFGALIDDQIFAAHGGIPGPVMKVAQIEAAIPTCLEDDQDTLAEQLVWNDPVGSDYYLRIKSKFDRELMVRNAHENAPDNFLHNTNRQCGYFFTEQAVRHFLDLNQLIYIIRAHQFWSTSFKCDFGGRVITVFSSSNYCRNTNMATVALVSQDKRIQIIQINHR